MLNLHDYISSEKEFRKFKVDELLFVEYSCLVDEPRSEIWSHTNYFAYVLGGKKMWKTFKAEYVIDTGDLIFVKKGATSVFQYLEQAFYVLFVFIPDDFITNVIRKHSIKFKPLRVSPVPESDKVIVLTTNDIYSAYFESLLLYFQQPNPPANALLVNRLEELILNSIYYDNNTQLSQYFNRLCTHTKLSMQHVMEENFYKNLSLSEYARLCAKSLSVFKRDFSSLYGCSPGKWLTGKRLEYSKYLLEVTNIDIEEVMLESGFNNTSHFIRVFKERYGTTPLRLRKDYAGDSSQKID